MTKSVKASSSSKRAAAKSERKPLPTQQLFITAVVVAVVLNVAFYFAPGGGAPAELTDYLKEISADMHKAKLIRAGDGTLRLVATADLKRGERVFSVPRPAVAYEQAIRNHSIVGRLLSEEFIPGLRARLIEGQANPEFFHVFQFAVYFALERRNPSSPWQPVFKELGTFDERDGALYWSLEGTKCLDKYAHLGAQFQHKGLAASDEAAQVMCEAQPELCGEDGPPTREEIKWGMTVYLKYNFQDQAVIPVMMFASFDNRYPGLTIAYNRETNMVDVSTLGAVAKGSELHTNNPRGPTDPLISRGIFDPATSGADVMIDVRSLSRTELGKHVCLRHQHEFVYGVDGKPKDALVSCVALMIMTEETRKQFTLQTFKTHRQDLSFMKQVHMTMLEDIQNTVAQVRKAKSECDESTLPSHPKVRAMFEDYMNFLNDVLTLNAKYLAETVAKYLAEGH
jgi:hypothetical protein